MDKPIRIGILSDSLEIPSYIFDPLRSLIEQGKLEVPVVCLNESPERSTLLEKLPKLGRVAAQTTFRLLSKTRSESKLRHVSELGAGIDIKRIRPRSTRFSDRFSNDDVMEIRAHDCDFLMRNGFKILRGDVLQAARYGVLSFHHGDNLLNRGGPALYWEFAERWANSGVILQLLTEELDGGTVLARGFPQLTIWDYNLSENNLQALSGAILYRFLEVFDPDQIVETPWFEQVYDRKLYMSANLLRGIAHIGSFLGRVCSKVVSKALTNNKWSIFVGPLAAPLRRYREITPPKAEFWADPFLVREKGKDYVFFERYKYADARGTIGVLQLDENYGVVRDINVEIGESCHLSFPNVFRAEGEIYMVPESSENEVVALYRCCEFPHRFKKVCVLLTGVSAVDTSIIQHSGMWWLFTSHSSFLGSSTVELQVYSSQQLCSETWVKHPKSPVKMDVRSGRNAGQLFYQNGKLFRAAQDGTFNYGRRITIYEVTVLTETDYSEKFVRHIEPMWKEGINRCHTFNVNDGSAVLDASANHFRWRI